MQYLTREERLLPLTSVYNIRDLGGYETQTGAYSKSHKYIRSGKMNRLMEVDRQYLKDYGIKVIIDLRSGYERKKEPDVLENDEDFDYYFVDLFNQEGASLVPRNLDIKDMGDLYCMMLDQCEQGIKKVFEIFLDHPYEGILFHCSAGKDRTGVISALLLDLVGCHEYDIVKDYSESYENNEPINDELEKDLEPGQTRFLYSEPLYMMKMLNHLRENYGSTSSYLAKLGFDEEKIEDLIENFTF